MFLSRASLKFHESSLPWHCLKHCLNELGSASFSRLILMTLEILGWPIIKLPNYIQIILGGGFKIKSFVHPYLGKSHLADGLVQPPTSIYHIIFIYA